MTIREIQKQIADALNGVEALVQGGCKAFAEDVKDVVAIRVIIEGSGYRTSPAGTPAPRGPRPLKSYLEVLRSWGCFPQKVVIHCWHWPATAPEVTH